MGVNMTLGTLTNYNVLFLAADNGCQVCSSKNLEEFPQCILHYIPPLRKSPVLENHSNSLIITVTESPYTTSYREHLFKDQVWLYWGS